MKHTIEKRFLAVQKCLKGHAPKDVARQLGLVDDDLYVRLQCSKIHIVENYLDEFAVELQICPQNYCFFLNYASILPIKIHNHAYLYSK